MDRWEDSWSCACICCSNIKLINVYAHALIQMWRSVGSLWESVVGSRDQIQVPLGLVAHFLTKPFHLPNSNLRVWGGYLSDTLIRIERGGVGNGSKFLHNFPRSGAKHSVPDREANQEFQM